VEKLLLFVFATHMPFFAWRYYRKGELRYAATAFTFALLALMYGLRVFAPGVAVNDVPLHAYIRVPAGIAAAFSIGLLLWSAVRRWLSVRPGP
jgi:hypothetical protein